MPQLNQSKFLKLYCTWLFTIQYSLFTCSTRMYMYSEDLFDRIFFFKGVASVGIKSSLPVISEALHLPQTNHALPVWDKKICSVCDKSRPTCLRQIKPYLHNKNQILPVCFKASSYNVSEPVSSTSVNEQIFV